MIKKTIASMILLGVCCTPVMALAQHDNDHHDDHYQQNDHHQQYVRHDDWKRGYHMRQEDWSRGERVDDWRGHHLRQPPRGYEWREVDGNYVLAAVATGVIASIIAESAAH